VPIDHVIGGLTDIDERMAAASGRTYHLVSGAPVPVAAFRTLALGYQHLHAASCRWRADCAARSPRSPQAFYNFSSRNCFTSARPALRM